MPKYARISPRDARLDRQYKQAQISGQAEQQDTASQAAMMDMMMKMYGLQQEQQMSPEKLRAAQLENRGREIANTAAQTTADWNPYMLGLAGRQGEAKASEAEATSAWTPTMLGQQYDEGTAKVGAQNAVSAAELARARHEGVQTQIAETTRDWTPTLLGQQYNEGTAKIGTQNAASEAELARAGYERSLAATLPDKIKAEKERNLATKMQALAYVSQITGHQPTAEQINTFMGEDSPFANLLNSTSTLKPMGNYGDVPATSGTAPIVPPNQSDQMREWLKNRQKPTY